jgi:uncharacterized membrane protein YbhN (UPF0104 family)
MKRGQIIGILLTLVFLGLAFNRVDISQLTEAMRSANYLAVIPAAICTLCGYLLRTLRWQIIMGRGISVPFGPVFGILMIGFATNNLLPARLGEFARAYLVQRRTGVRKTFFISTIFLERLFDGLVLISLLLLFSMRWSLPGWGREVQLLSTVLFVSLAGGVALVIAKPGWARSLMDIALRPVPKRAALWLAGTGDMFLQGLGTMRRPLRLGSVAALSCTIWLLEGLSYYAVTRGFDLPLSPGQFIAASALLLVMVNLGIMIPSAPGYVGTFQFFAISALMVFNVPRESALAVAIVSHLMQYILVTAVGIFFLGRENLRLGSLFGQADSPTDAVASGAAR